MDAASYVDLYDDIATLDQQLIQQRASGRPAVADGIGIDGTEYNGIMLPAIEVGVTRQDPDSNGGPILNGAERVDLDAMLRAYTIHGAWLMGLEELQGSIQVGKRADLVVLDRNLFEIPAAQISDANVLMTIFDGRVVYREEGRWTP